ncbi:DSC-2, partial [Biomphalaria pfeifferi]
MRNIIALNFLFYFVCLLDASQINFQSTPFIINPVLTKTLTLRCSAQEFSSATSSYWHTTTTANWRTTTHRTTHPPETTTTRNAITTNPWFFQDTSTESNVQTSNPETTASNFQTEADVTHVMSIIISKLNKFTNQLDPVADVTPFDSATAGAMFKGSVSLNGSTSGSTNHREMGFLEVTFNYPDDKESGEYTCEIFALNHENHPVNLRSILTVISREPSISDLVKYISNQEKRFEEIKNYEKRFDEIKSQNIQRGSVSCRSSDSSIIHFQHSYNTIPMVFTSFTSIASSGNYGTSIQVTIDSVTTTSF